MKLVIAEKPSVAQDLARVLGASQRRDGYCEGMAYLVSWCYGHLAGLADAGTYDERYAKWKLEDLPILPSPFRFLIAPDKQEQFGILRALMNRESAPGTVPPPAPPKEQKPDYSLPFSDPAITPHMAEQCGYTIPDMYPLSKDRAMELLEKDVVIFTLYPDKPAEMVFDAEDIANHDGFFGITCEDWQSIHDTIPARDVHRRFLETPGDAYAVMQLKGSAPAELRYTGLNYLSQPPSPGNYDILYTGPIACTQNQSATLENLFEIFNTNRPGDFTGHSLSVSDIIALKQDGVVSYHYCDNVGFQELPGFMSENYLKTAEMSTEDDYGMIDGIINNGKQPISLMDGTERNQQEKKPSVLKKLKEQPPQSASERKPRKTKEKEI